MRQVAAARHLEDDEDDGDEDGLVGYGHGVMACANSFLVVSRHEGKS